jgi:diguanylate cyclase (GGDEF)-like protein/PAS domain S-box-containing protein
MIVSRQISLLTIDNDQETQSHIRSCLKNHDFSILEADDSVTGTRILERDQPEIVLLGLDMSGFWTTLTRAKEISPGIPIIIMTGENQQSEIAQALQAGAWDYLLKPLHNSFLFLHTVRRNLEHARLIRENAGYNLERDHLEDTEELRKREGRYRSIYENLQDVYFETSLDGTILEISPSVKNELQYKQDELVGTSVYSLYSDEKDRLFLLQQLSTEGKVNDYEVIFKDRDGSPLYCAMTAVLLRDDTGAPAKICGNIRNITARKLMEKDLREREDHYRSLVANIPVGICRCTPGIEGGFIMANPAIASMLGHASIEDLMRTSPSDLYTHEPDHQEVLARLYRHGEIVFSELLIKKNDGSPLWVTLSAYLVRDTSGNPRYIDILTEDISKRKEAEEQVRRLAFFDPLTDLPNRSMLLFHLNQAISGARRRSTQGGVIFMDLDRFKIVNDSLGHEIGDILLQKVAERLKKLIRTEDTIARIGSDEFALLFTDVGTTPRETGQKLVRIAEKIRHAMSKMFLIDSHELYITATIGIALFSGDADKAEEILRHASTAVSRCKKTERNRCMFYLPDMQAAVDQRLIIEKELRWALERNELQLFFQPQVEASGRIIGAEALIRWQHPERGFIPPMEFIPIAEETGLILRLGEWVLSEACRRMTSWKRQGIGRHLQHVAVNISPWQFRQPDFTTLVKRVLAETGAEPSMLTIEITEGVAIDNLEDTIAKMLELKKMNIRFSIDDFGTGYSSLSYLHRLPLDQLKIDRSFTQGLAKGSRFASIVSTIIILAENLGLSVIAEGVETATELNFLLENDCTTFQGYYFSRPLAPADFENRLKAHTLTQAPAGCPDTSPQETAP